MPSQVFARVNESDAAIDRATSRINELVSNTGLQVAIAIGHIVVEELYDGDLSSWRQRGAKEHTLRQLAANPMLGISASALFRALAIYEIRARFPDHPCWETLTACHIRAVIGLPDEEQQRLLELANVHELSTQALELEAAKVRSEHKSSRGGRPRKPRFLRSIESAERAMVDEEAVFGDLDALYSMSAKDRGELARRLSFVRQRCEELVSLIST